MSCPTGYFAIPGDSSNCANSTQTSIVLRTCPAGLVLQGNGLCGTNTPTIIQTAATYCGPQYATKNCVYTSQLTSALTPATGNEAIPNTICAFIEAGIQTPCDPGCCSSNTTTTATTTETTTETETPFPLWAIILLIVIGTLILMIIVYLATRKKKLIGNSNGLSGNAKI
jgi:hypothetical protein